MPNPQRLDVTLSLRTAMRDVVCRVRTLSPWRDSAVPDICGPAAVAGRRFVASANPAPAYVVACGEFKGGVGRTAIPLAGNMKLNCASHYRRRPMTHAVAVQSATVQPARIA